MTKPDPAKRPKAKGTRTPSPRVAWTGTLDRVIGRAQGARSKLFFFAFVYSTIIFLGLFFTLRLVFGTAFGGDAATGSWSLGAIFLLLLVTSFGSLGALDFFLIRPLRSLESINPQAPLGVMIASFFDKHAALESRFSEMAVELKGLADDRQTLSAEISQLAVREDVAASTLKVAISTTNEMLAVTDAQGRLRDLSPPLQRLLDVRLENVVGQPFTEVIRLFDANDPRPLECPLPDLVQEAVVQRTSSPNLDRAILLDARDGQHAVKVGVAAVEGSEGTDGPVVSAVVRLTPEVGHQAHATPGTHTAVEAPGRTGPERILDAGAFVRRAEALIEKGRSEDTMQVLLLASVDGQESVTDRYGFAAGESLMWEIGQLLLSKLPDSAECFRMSGTHFAVLLPGTAADRFVSIAEDIRAAVERREFAWRDARYNVTLSIGAVPFGADCEGYRTLLEQADATLIAAKTNGGNRVEALVVDKALRERRRNDAQWVEWVDQRALKGGVHLISQEIRPLDESRKPMLETLARIEDDDGVWVEPGAFLPALRRRNATAKLDLQLIRRAGSALQKGPAQVDEFATLFVNISGTSIMVPRFRKVVGQSLEAAPRAAKRLGFEISFLDAIEHTEAFARFVQVVKNAGASVALDRCKSAVGLEILSNLPIDFVKIDASLVRKATAEALDRSHIEWIQRTVRLLGRKTVAMGVSDEATLTLMREIGVDYMQGTQVNKMGPLIL